MGWPVPAQAKIDITGYETGVGSTIDISDHDFIVRGNQPPALRPIGIQMVRAGEHLTFTVQASDPDGEPLTFRCVNPPAGATLDPTTGVFQWTPTAGQVGVHQGVRFEVSDGAWTAGRQARIAVLRNVAISGMLVTSIGRRPVSGIRVELELRMSLPPWVPPSVSTASTTTDAQGRFRFEGLSAGLYTIRLIAPAGRRIMPASRPVVVQKQDRTLPEFRLLGQ